LEETTEKIKQSLCLIEFKDVIGDENEDEAENEQSGIDRIELRLKTDSIIIYLSEKEITDGMVT
jgi:hypothetical protein